MIQSIIGIYALLFIGFQFNPCLGDLHLFIRDETGVHGLYIPGDPLEIRAPDAIRALGRDPRSTSLTFEGAKLQNGVTLAEAGVGAETILILVDEMERWDQTTAETVGFQLRDGSTTCVAIHDMELGQQFELRGTKGYDGESTYYIKITTTSLNLINDIELFFVDQNGKELHVGSSDTSGLVFERIISQPQTGVWHVPPVEGMSPPFVLLTRWKITRGRMIAGEGITIRIFQYNKW